MGQGTRRLGAKQSLSSDDSLSDAALAAALKIPALSQVQASAEALRLAAREQLGLIWKRCSPHHRCGSMACLVCLRLQQLKVISSFPNSPLNDGSAADATSLWALTAVPASGRIPIQHLHEEDLLRHRGSLARLFREEAPTMRAICALDISRNVMSGIGEEDHWQLHVHCIVDGLTDKEKRKLRRV